MKIKHPSKPATLVTIIILTLALILFWLLFISRPNQGDQNASLQEAILTVDLIDLSQTKNRSGIKANGLVESEDQATLTTETGGTISQVLVRVGDQVQTGQELIRLENTSAINNLNQAESLLVSQRARLTEIQAGSRPEQIEILKSAVVSAESALEQTKKQSQDNIENARKALLNTDLRAYLNSSASVSESNNPTPPTISGIYDRDQMGEYRITLYRSSTQSGYSFRYQGPNDNGTGVVSTLTPQPLGQSGLSILFPENFLKGPSVEWSIPVPNDRSPAYIQALNLYNNALNNQEPTIKQAEEVLKQRQEELTLALSGSRQEQIQAQEAQVRQAEIAVAEARNQLNKRTIKAPFPGTVSAVSAQVGELVPAGQGLVTVVNERGLRLTTFVSPDNARNITAGDPVKIKEGEIGVVSAVSRALNPQTGQVEVQIVILSGETNLIIGEYLDLEILASTENFNLLVPLSALEITSAGTSVFTVKDQVATKVPVTIGSVIDDKVEILSSTDDLEQIIERIAGVKEGQKINIKTK